MQIQATYQDAEKMSYLINTFYQSALKPYKNIKGLSMNSNISVAALHAEESYNHQNTIMLNITLNGATYGLVALDNNFNIPKWLNLDKKDQNITIVDMVNDTLNPAKMVIQGYGKMANMKNPDEVYNAVTEIYSLQEVINKYDHFRALKTGIHYQEDHGYVKQEDYKVLIQNINKTIDIVTTSLKQMESYYTPTLVQDFIDYTNQLADGEKIILNNQLAYSPQLYQITREETYSNVANYLNTLILYSWDFIKFQLEQGHKTFAQIASEKQ